MNAVAVTVTEDTGSSGRVMITAAAGVVGTDAGKGSDKLNAGIDYKNPAYDMGELLESCFINSLNA